MLKLIILLTIVASFCDVPIQCAKVLVIVPTPSLSHNLFYRPIILELARRGHEVTLITGDPMKDPKHKNLIEIDVRKELYGSMDAGHILLSQQNQAKPSATDVLKMWTPDLATAFDKLLNNTQVKKALKTNKYDVLLQESLMYYAFFPLKQYLKCPMIGIQSFDVLYNNNDAFGNVPFPSYYLDWLHDSGADLTFRERMWNFISFLELQWYNRFEVVPLMQEVATRHFGNIDVLEAEKTFDLMLLNGNPIFNPARPLMPAMIHIGGLHYRERNPLPNDLKTYLDAQKQGVIYFSLGSNIKSKSLPNETLGAILEAFTQLQPYQILLKWENDDLPNKPKNVHVAKWLPQQDVLDHPNVKAFVTQAGLQSVEEAISSKVPMLCIPIGSDQPYNANRIKSLQIGNHLPYAELTTDRMVADLKEIIQNPLYQQKMNKISVLLWDQPQKPLDRAIWWIEYVIRHKGAEHLRSPAVNMSWFKLLSLDVISFLFIALLTVLGIFLFGVKCILSLIFGSKSKKLKKN